ncbi:MAG TPA: carboxypeptidase regulatory-like domain-containing protein [Candidatus Acidoferrum sp.]
MLRRWGIVLAVSSILAACAVVANAAAACATAANAEDGGAKAANGERSSLHEGEQEQQQDQGQEGKPSEQSGGQEFSIGGTVVDSATGKPIGHALVVLDGNGRSPTRRVISGEDGRFEIEGLREIGEGNIEAHRPGYFSPRSIRTNRYSSMGGMQTITVEPGANITIKLTPEGTIAGQVVDESGEPIEGLTVQLIFESALEGKWTPRLQDRATTTEEGRFRFASLASGRYFVLAGPSEEVASRNSQRGHTALGYPAVFYGGGRDYSTASAIDLTAGKHAELDMRLALEPFFHIRGTITGNPLPGPPTLKIINSAQQQVGQTEYQKPDREFQMALVPGGSYTIRAKNSDYEKKVCAVFVKHIDLTRDVFGMRLAMTPCPVIPVDVHIEHTKEGQHRDSNYLVDSDGILRPGQPYGARVLMRLRGDPSPFPRFRSQVEKTDEPGRASIRDVEPGTYDVEVQALAGLYVESAQSGLTDLQRDDLVVGEGAAVPPIEVRLRDDGAELTGKISGKDVNEVAVAIAIPEGTDRGAKVAMAMQGQYHFKNLAPGNYRMVAVDRVDDFAYAERDVMGKYLAKAKEVTLRPNDKATVDLEFARVEGGEP